MSLNTKQVTSQEKLTAEEILFAEKILSKALEKGVDKIRIYLSKNIENDYSYLNGEIDKICHSMDRSISIHLFSNNKYGTFSINKFDEKDLDFFLEKSIETVNILAQDPYRDLPDIARVEKNAITGTELELYDDCYSNIDNKQRLSLLAKGSLFKDNLTRENNIIEELSYCDQLSDIILLDSNGARCRHTETSFSFVSDISIEDDKGNKYSAYYWVENPIFEKLAFENCSQKALERALAKFSPKNHKSCKCTMILENMVAAKVLMPIISALNANNIQQNNSFLKDYLNKTIFHEGLTIEDCPREKGKTGATLFDSEGVSCINDTIIEKGRIVKYFVNSYMANKMGIAPTISDASRLKIAPYIDYQHFNTKKEDIDNKLDLEKILSLCKDGILVSGFNGGNCNPATGDFSYGVEGFLIKEGKIAHPIKEMLITGNFIQLWKNFIAAGSDTIEHVANQIPTLAFKDVDFSG